MNDGFVDLAAQYEFGRSIEIPPRPDAISVGGRPESADQVRSLFSKPANGINVCGSAWRLAAIIERRNPPIKDVGPEPLNATNMIDKVAHVPLGTVFDSCVEVNRSGNRQPLAARRDTVDLSILPVSRVR